MKVFSYYRPISRGHFFGDDEEDNIVLAQLITPENDPYDDAGICRGVEYIIRCFWRWWWLNWWILINFWDWSVGLYFFLVRSWWSAQ